LVTWSFSIEGSLFKGEMDFQNGEFSLDDNSIKTFFFWFIFIDDWNGLKKV